MVDQNMPMIALPWRRNTRKALSQGGATNLSTEAGQGSGGDEAKSSESSRGRSGQATAPRADSTGAAERSSSHEEEGQRRKGGEPKGEFPSTAVAPVVDGPDQAVGKMPRHSTEVKPVTTIVEPNEELHWGQLRELCRTKEGIRVMAKGAGDFREVVALASFSHISPESYWRALNDLR